MRKNPPHHRGAPGSHHNARRKLASSTRIFPVSAVVLDHIKPHPRNTRTHSKKQIRQIADSIQAVGFAAPVLIDENGVLLAGHGRLEAARLLGLKTIPAMVIDGLTEARKRALLLADNRIAQSAGWDRERLADELISLPELLAADGLDISVTGFEPAEIDALMADFGDDIPDPSDDIEPALLSGVPVTRHGDLWQLGRHRIIHGSCLDEAVLTWVLDGQMPTMVFADPPYGVSIVTTHGFVGGGEAYDIPFGGVKHPRRRGYVGGGQRTKDLTGHYPIESWGKDGRRNGERGPVKGTLHGAAPIGKYAPVIGDDSTELAIAASALLLDHYPKAIQIWWGGNYYADHLPASSCWLVWNKETGHTDFADCELAWTNQPNAVRMFTHRWNGMLRASEHERRWHPTQKPAALAAWVYRTLGKTGDVILDPFLGSAPSLLAAEQCEQRTLYGCELSLEYLAIALERWHQLTGFQPERLA